MRLVMMATGDFAVPLLEALSATNHHLVALATRPPRAAARRRSAAAPPRVVLAARSHEITVLTPASVNAVDFQRQLAALAPDLLVVCDFGEILTAETLAVARLGGINLHGSLLPKYRGAAPVAWAIYHGERETGVTVIQMSAQLDAGPCIAQARTAIREDETAGQLAARLAELGAPLVCNTVDQLAAGRVQPIGQDPALASRAPRLKKSDGRIDWTRTAVEIRRQIRAMQPWPTAYTFWRRPQGQPLRMIVLAAATHTDGTRRTAAETAPGGTIVEAGPRLLVTTGCGDLELVRIQPAGKRPVSAAELLRGYRLKVGDRLTEAGAELPSSPAGSLE